VTLNTVKRYDRASEPGRLQRVPKYRPTLVNPYRDYLRKRREEEPGVAVQLLLREIRELGYPGSSNLIVRYLNQGRADARRPHLSPRRATRIFLTRPDNRTGAQRETAERLASACPETTALDGLTGSLAAMLAPAPANEEKLQQWIAAARAADLPTCTLSPCPQGKTSASWTPCTQRGTDAIVATFSADDCGPCPARGRCTTSSRDRHQLTVPPRDVAEAQAAARAEEKTISFQADYARRAGVEGTMHQAASHGARRARYRGLPKTRLDHAYMACALNLLRLHAYWTGTPLDRRRTSHLARLELGPAALPPNKSPGSTACTKPPWTSRPARGTSPSVPPLRPLSRQSRTSSPSSTEPLRLIAHDHPECKPERIAHRRERCRSARCDRS
jgi:hypothetical protein